MLNYWLDPLFLEMLYDRYLRGTVLGWHAVWQPAVWVLAGLLASFLWAKRPAHAHRLLLLACLAAVLTPLFSVVVERMNLGILRHPAPESSYALHDPDDGAAPATESSTARSSRAFVPAKVSRPFSVGIVLLWAWLVLSALCAVRLFWSLGLGWRLLARAKPLHDERLQRALHAAAASWACPARRFSARPGRYGPP